MAKQLKPGGYTTSWPIRIRLLGIFLAIGVFYFFTARSNQENQWVPLPPQVLDDLSLKNRELPKAYVMVTDTNLLQRSGIQTNPGYLQRSADRDTLITIGADASFLALYGGSDEVLLILRGVFFRETADAEVYLDVQASRQRPVLAFQRPIDETGVWLLFFARDPDRAYSDEEIAAIQKGLERYRKRLGLEIAFDHLHYTD